MPFARHNSLEILPIDALGVTCARCLTTSVGTRTRHAANSPQLARNASHQTAKKCKDSLNNKELDEDKVNTLPLKN